MKSDKTSTTKKIVEVAQPRLIREPFAGCAWLHRRGKPTWMFRPDPRYGHLAHTTRSGTIYLIMPGLHEGKAFWVGRATGETVFTVEKYLRGREIEFCNGGRYIFPNVQSPPTGDLKGSKPNNDVVAR